jgi:hypothetical protein
MSGGGVDFEEKIFEEVSHILQGYSTVMHLKKLLEREAYVAIHAQSWKFRVVKYLVLAILFTGVWAWGGWSVVVPTFLVLLVLALIVHFLFRWKTKAWTESWGPYKKLDLPK